MAYNSACPNVQLEWVNSRMVKLRKRLDQTLKLSWLVVIGAWGGLEPTSVMAQSPRICPAQLDEAIASVTQRPEFRRIRWGILVQTQDSGETLYAQEAGQFFIPASNAKLLTTAAALEKLGPQFRIRTSIEQIDPQSGGVVLRVAGRGDPSLTDAELAALAQQLSDRDITEIDLLIGDDSYFQGDPVHPTWEWEDIQAGYGAPVNSLILNQNAIGLTLVPQALGEELQVIWDDPTEESAWQIVNRSTTAAANAPEFLSVGRDFSQPIIYVQGQLRAGSASEPVAVSIPRPSQYFMQRFLQALLANNIRVNQAVITTSPVSEQGIEIAFVESPTLAELLVETNQESNNLYAEALLRSLGAVEAPNADLTLQAGLSVVETTLTQIAIDPESYSLVDGSGLSRRNLISPEALVQTLRAMSQSPNAITYRNSLTSAGINGTLQNRFQDTPVEGRFHGKTGALSDTVTLSGYLEPPNHPALVLSILVNQSNQPLNQIQQAVDELLKLLTQLQVC